MGDYDDAEPGTEGRRRPWMVGAVVLLALVVGLVAGYLLGGGTSTSSSVAEVRTVPETGAPTAAPTTAPAAPVAPGGAAAAEPCLRAGEAAARVLAELEGAVTAIGALDAGALREVLDRLQPVQGDLEGAVAACGDRLPAPAPGPTG